MLERIQKRGYLTIGVSSELPGFAWRPHPGAALRGLEIDLAAHFTKTIFGCSEGMVQSHMQLFEMPLAYRGQSLLDRDVDMVISNYADTPERRKTIAFAGHYLSSMHAAVVLPDSDPVITSDDLRALQVAVVFGTTDHDVLVEAAPEAEIIALPSVTHCLAALDSGRVQAFWSTTAANLGYLNDPSVERVQSKLQLGGEQ